MVTDTTATAKNQPTPEEKLPYIHEDQIFDRQFTEEDGIDNYGVDVDESYIWGVSGVRGSGKSETLAYFGARGLCMGLPVWSNFPIKFKYLRHGKDPLIVESKPLMFKDLFSIADYLRGGVIIVDEYQDWANALNFMSTQNKLLNAFWAQIRKNQLSFVYAAKKLRWIDLKTREETDIEIRCQDAAKKPGGRREYLKGEKILHDYVDWSGNWTGKAYEDYPISFPYTFYARFLWGIYDTNQRFDIFEAMRGYKVDLTKNTITDKEDGGTQINMEQLEQMAIGLFKRDHKWRSTEFFDTIGIPREQRARTSVLLKDMGVKEKYQGNSRFFTFDPDLELEDDIKVRVPVGV